MHVYLRDEPVTLEMRAIDPEGMIPEESDLVAIAFYVDDNESPSFRALLPPETVAVLEKAIHVPVQLGLLAEEPESEEIEIHAMVGLSVPVSGAMPEEMGMEMKDAPEGEPWKTGNPDAWKGEDDAEEEIPRTALLTFAPLMRLRRKFPDDFGEELADLLESALVGATRPNLEARVDRMLDDL
ncbi:hypothetical protein BH23GEM3_BH23GEM3_03020 [soil metagenome]